MRKLPRALTSFCFFPLGAQTHDGICKFEIMRRSFVSSTTSSVTLLLACCSINACSYSRHALSYIGIGPRVVSTNYDYTRPVDIAKRNKPVWILPKTNVGWVKGYVDKVKGDWHSGEYVGTIIEPGHWATLEEAELSGQPYIVAGENRSILPEPVHNPDAGDAAPSSTLPIPGLDSRQSKTLTAKTESFKSAVTPPPLAQAKE